MGLTTFLRRQPLKPSLDLDFLKQVYKMNLIQRAFADIFTFSRASAATRINAAGQIESVASNQPRFDYEPADVPILGPERWAYGSPVVAGNVAAWGAISGSYGGAPLILGKSYYWTLTVSGLSSFNSQSLQIGTSVVKTITANGTFWGVVSSLDALTMVLKEGSVANASAGATFAISVKEITGYTVRKGDPKGLLIEEQRTRINTISLAPVVNESVAVTAQPYTLSFYGAGTVTLSGAHVQVVSGAGAFPARKTYTFTPVAGTLTMAYSGSCQDVQVEAGAFATSVIRGEGAQVSRAADVCSINTLSPWFKADAGTLFVEYCVSGIPKALAAHCALSVVGSSGFNERLVCGQILETSIRSGGMASGGVDSALLVAAGLVPVAGAVYKSAVSWDALGMIGCSNGGAVAVDNSVVLPAVTRMIVGSLDTVQRANAYIRYVKFMPMKTGQSQIQALTA